MSNGKVLIIHLIIGLIKKIPFYKVIYFPEPYDHNRNKIKFDLNLSNHATKFDLKNATGVDTSKFPKKTNLTSLKSEVHKLHVDKFKKVN